MSAYLKLMSGDILSFDTFEGYKFRNLRREFYDRMVDELSIRELECIIIFYEGEEVDLDGLVTDGYTYNVLVNNVYVSLIYDTEYNIIRFEHKYERFPDSAIVKITESVTTNMADTYRCLYNELVNGFQSDIDFFESDPDNYYRENTLPTFENYAENKYGVDIEFEDIVKEYIDYCIKKRFNVEEFDYE